jgi:redox-sensitive bicupin YhaK (pirin superfamily)
VNELEPNPEWFGNGPNDAANPSWTSKNWLKSRFHFSFAEYNNEDNTNFGVLRVLNDDLVQPRREFGEHPHRDVEICTYVVEGFLSHKDSMGTEETLGRGAVQFMVNKHVIYRLTHTITLRSILDCWEGCSP